MQDIQLAVFSERLFMSDSFDNVKSLVDHNMTEFYPQLQGCPLVEQIKTSKFDTDGVDKLAYRVMLLWH